MNWLKENWFKLGILIVVLVGLIAIGGFYYMSQVMKQDSIERQQRQEALQERQETLEMKEERDREFKASQKEACLGIYKQESSKWNNVNGWRYSEDEDNCYIQYKEGEKKTEAECDAQYKGDDGKLIPALFTDWLLCKDGLFEKTF